MAWGRREVREVKGRRINGKEISFYVSNIPEGVLIRDLWFAFKHYGIMSDAYIAKKKDIGGMSFGFIRFKGVENRMQFAERMNGTRVCGAILNVTVAMFDRRGIEVNDGKKIYVKKSDAQSGGLAQSSKPMGAMEKPTYKQVVEEGTKQVGGERRKMIALECPKLSYPQTVRGRAVLAVAKSAQSVCEAKKMMELAGYSNVALSYIGGLNMLVVFKKREHANEFMMDKKLVWERFLTKVTIWNGQDVPFERIAGLKIIGMPILLRDEGNFERIGKLFGSIVCPSETVWSRSDNSTGECFVLTKEGRRIEEEITVTWNGKEYTVWVVEELKSWIPNFFGDTSSAWTEDSSTNDGNDTVMEEGEIRSPYMNVPAEKWEAGKVNSVIEKLDGHGEGSERSHVHEIYVSEESMEDTLVGNRSTGDLNLVDGGNETRGEGCTPGGKNILSSVEMGHGPLKTPTSRKRPRRVRSPYWDSPLDFGLNNEIGAESNFDHNISELRDSHEMGMNENVKEGVRSVETGTLIREEEVGERSVEHGAGGSTPATTTMDLVTGEVESLIKEVRETIEVGKMVGVNLADHETLVRTTVLGEGGLEGKS